MKVRNNMLKESKVAVRILPTSLLALMPAVLNSSTPVKDLPMNAQELTEVVAQIPSEDVATIDFREVQQQKKIVNPFNIRYLDDRKIQEIRTTIANGEKANLVLVGHYGDGPESNIVRKVYFVKDGDTGRHALREPSFIAELVYHNIGDDAFLGAKVEKPIYDSKGEYKGAILREYRLDDESAQFLIDLTTGDTKWQDKTKIEFSVTQSSKLFPVTSLGF